MRPTVLVAVVFALLSFAGCGGEDATSTSGDTGGDGQTLAVAASDFMFAPADLQAEPGALTIELTNDGQQPHAIQIEGNGVDETSDTIEGGATTSFDLELEEGTYGIFCPVGNHADMGMVGTLTVGAGGAGAGGATTGDDSETATGSDDDGRY